MEQNMPYLMWMKSKQFQSPSWEEQAFAEDSSGPFVWPPRSYSCTFCNREFRSAQALGGHMNVHRRDRAKLKQSLCGEHECRISNPSSSSPKNSASSDLEVREHKERKRVFVSASSDSPGEDDGDGRSFVETRLCVGLKSYGCKRLRSGGGGSAALYSKRPCSSSSDDEVDLELRLGDSPAVK